MNEDRELDLIVIGGGPAGATAAATAARAGLSVLLLEAGAHPRAHVGESLLPGIIPILDAIGALQDVESAGFGQKSGATQINWGLTPMWDLWFADTDEYDHAWFVDRSRFDEILFHAARRAGVDAREHAVVRELVWEGDRLVGVIWKTRGDAELTRTRARFVLDASGQAALVANALRLREPIEGLRHRAAWAHFEGARTLPPPRAEQALFVAQPNRWIWCFPLSSTRMSVGIVQLDDAEPIDFDATVAACTELQDSLSGAHRVTSVTGERDWSYRVSRVAGPGYFLTGDAAGFLDPILSTGVFIGMHSGWHAARTLASVVKGERSEHDALADYQRHHAELFGDLLRMVRFYYQQNLHREDYFWESKRILMRQDTELRPQKAFLILTSGLVKNLAFDAARAVAVGRREAWTETRSCDLRSDETERVPETLGFVCMHFRWHGVEPAAQLWLLVEPSDAAAPTLFRTRNFHLNCVAPRYRNDPIGHPALGPILHAWSDGIRALDTVDGETLAEFWRRARDRVADAIAALPSELELVRVFGE